MDFHPEIPKCHPFFSQRFFKWEVGRFWNEFGKPVNEVGKL